MYFLVFVYCKSFNVLGDFPAPLPVTRRPPVFVRRKNFAKVRRKSVTSKFFFNFFLRRFRFGVSVSAGVATRVSCSATSLAPLPARLPSLEARLLPESECKGIHFFLHHQIFLKLFFEENLTSGRQNRRIHLSPTRLHLIKFFHYTTPISAKVGPVRPVGQV